MYKKKHSWNTVVFMAVLHMVSNCYRFSLIIRELEFLFC